jgi:hypothetical protein
MARILVKGSVLAAALAMAAAACSKSSTPSATSPSAAPAARIPTATTVAQSVVYGYYDGHIDTMLSTDVSDKAQAKAQHINYSPALLTQPAAKYPSLYHVMGTAAPNQPVVFGSEPGETDYSPLWQEVTVQWNAGATPVLLVKDDQIKELGLQGRADRHPHTDRAGLPIVKAG